MGKSRLGTRGLLGRRCPPSGDQDPRQNAGKLQVVRGERGEGLTSDRQKGCGKACVSEGHPGLAHGARGVTAVETALNKAVLGFPGVKAARERAGPADCEPGQQTADTGATLRAHILILPLLKKKGLNPIQHIGT